MTKAELLELLRRCAEDDDEETAHIRADGALLQFIDDPEIKEAYEAIDKWYS